ncbi:MAG: HAD family hydrolase [Anaerolineae bacterium]
MIRAMIFDLDGTLVQTEKLKALSYARAAVELCPVELSEEAVLAAFKDLVGLSRQEVAQGLIERFGLGDTARERMADFDVASPWQAFVGVRMRYYDAMLADPEMLRSNQWPHNVTLLHQARRLGCKTALATMSTREQALRVLDVLGLANEFDIVITRDDVEHGKPHREIYQRIAQELNVQPGECLVVEDSPAGVQAAVDAGAHVIAVTTPFTRGQLRGSDLLPAAHIVDDPDALPQAVAHMAAKHGLLRTPSNAGHVSEDSTL